MRRMIRIFVSLFMVLITLLIIIYVLVITLLSKETVRNVHDTILPLQYIGTFLGIYDNSHNYDETYQIKQRIGANLGQFLEWKQQGDGAYENTSNFLALAGERNDIALYSPVWTLVGTVGTGVTKMTLTYAHQGRDVVTVLPIQINDTTEIYTWSYDVSLSKETMFNGLNTYLIEATFTDGTVLSRKVHISVNYDRIQLGDGVLYLDPSYIPADMTEDILRESPDLDGEPVNFINYGCDPAVQAPPILVQHTYQYKTLPACLTFSLAKDYLLRFEFQSEQDDRYLYDIVSPRSGVLYRNYPLFTQGLNTTYFHLVFRDPVKEWLKFLEARGDDLSYALHINFFDPKKEQNIIDILFTDGNQLLVENAKEKILIYLYKEWDRYTSLLYPGLRYQFFYRGASQQSWGKVNEGAIHSLPDPVYGPTIQGESTFSFTMTLDDMTLFLDDGIKVTTFSIDNIGNTIDSKDIEQVLNQSNICDTIDIGIYQNIRGEVATQPHVKDVLRLAGAGAHVSKLEIFHNGKRTGRIPENLYNGWFHDRLHSERGNLVAGENIYTIKAYNERGRKICQKKISVMVHE